MKIMSSSGPKTGKPSVFHTQKPGSLSPVFLSRAAVHPARRHPAGPDSLVLLLLGARGTDTILLMVVEAFILSSCTVCESSDGKEFSV